MQLQVIEPWSSLLSSASITTKLTNICLFNSSFYIQGILYLFITSGTLFFLTKVLVKFTCYLVSSLLCRRVGAMEAKKCNAAVGNTMDKVNFILKNLNSDILGNIFKRIDIFESNLAVSRFTEAWKKASNDEPVWQTLDFSMLKSDFVKTLTKPYVWVHSRSDASLSNLLFVALNLSQGNVKTLIFHYNLFLTNEQFIYTATRCPLVRRLVFVSWNCVKKIGIITAIRMWKDLVSMTMPNIRNPEYVFYEISMHCKNFRELKVMGFVDVHFASSLVRYLPNLKVLSLRCSGLSKEALILILDELKHLEVLNISHSCYVELEQNPRDGYKYSSDIDPIIIDKASRLREFHTCMKESCIMCKRTRDDDGYPRWYKYEEGIWKQDEVSSLAL
ncbi:F-box/LRR-repeat protein At3g48880-like isoform X1 [Trifolium pratense]|uniref:F-box/LRR-repeat protein At3g48880-like isoform X1 n=2 Tax=Trifolium pratense TaxID=57577 RepID=UPI001E6954CF|nr:F-box/LRR-repeat protein At3g48880-like isoform X1 [Trifolium pratense]